MQLGLSIPYDKTTETGMAGSIIEGGRDARSRAIAQAVVGSTQVRPPFEHLAGQQVEGLHGVEALLF